MKRSTKDAVGKLNGADPGAWFEATALEALAFLSVESRPDYERAVFAARKAKVSLRDLKAEVRKRARISNSKKPTGGGETHETHSNSAETSTTQGLEGDFETHSETHSAVRCGKLIVRPGRLPEIVDAAERILVRVETDFYQRGGYLARTCVKRAETVRGITRPEGAITIIPIDTEYLLDKLNRLIQWKRMKSIGGDIIEEVECDAPRKVAVSLLARRGHWLARPLTGVINAPTLRPDGSILDKPGYDAATGLLLIGDGVEFLSIPERPGRDKAVTALAVLKGVIRDFPFAALYDRSAAISAILTGIIRHSLRTAPMHTFSAPKMAAGKTLLADIVSLITTGVPATVTSYTEDVDEMRKRIISILVQGDLIINIDNIETPFSSQTLCTVLTQEEFTDRLLGTNRTVTAPTNCCWLATGNNLLIKGDLITRVIPCSLDPGCETPETREFDKNLYEWIPQNRWRLIQAALTVLRAYHVAGRPKQSFQNFARFEDWSGWVRAALVWLGETDPCLGREKLVDADPVSRALRNLLIAWHETYGKLPATTKQAITDANKTLTSAEGDIHHEHEALRDALLEVCGERDGKLNGRKLGRHIEKYERRVEVGARFKRAGSKDRYIRWLVDLVDEDRFSRVKNEVQNESQNQPETHAPQGSGANSNEFHEFRYPGGNFSNAKCAREGEDGELEEGDA
jgi:putative DNA primase/helicase